MKAKGGILLIFSLVVTFVALGILFLLSSTSIANLRAVSTDYTGSQLVNNIKKGIAFINNNALPEFGDDNLVTIETIEAGNIVIKRETKMSSRFQGQFTSANLGNHNHLKALEDNFTISFWFKTQNTPSPVTGLKLPFEGEPLLGFSQKRLGDYQGSGFQFSFVRINNNTAARLKFGITLSDDEASTYHSLGIDNVTDDLWTMVTVTYDGNQLKIYENENLQEQTNVTGTVDWSTIANSSFYIGRYIDTPMFGVFFSGQVRNVGMWNNSVNSDGVLKIYNQGMSFNPLVEFGSYQISDDLLGFWKLNDGQGTTLLDYSTFSSHGSIINRNNSNQCWTTMTDSFRYIITSEFNGFQRSEKVR